MAESKSYDVTPMICQHYEIYILFVSLASRLIKPATAAILAFVKKFFWADQDRKHLEISCAT